MHFDKLQELHTVMSMDVHADTTVRNHELACIFDVRSIVRCNINSNMSTQTLGLHVLPLLRYQLMSPMVEKGEV